jgi:AcrR family transcriptional regulator
MSAVGLRARKKERTRDELAAAALALFDEHGFDGATIEAIAAAAEVSPRTFFRYFPTKEDVLFGGDAGAGGEREALVMAALRHHPGAESPRVVLRDVMQALVATYETELPTLLLRKRVIAASPALRTRAIERRHTWEAAVVEALRDRFGRDPGTTFELRVTVAAITAGMQVAIDAWLESDGVLDLGELVAHALDHLSAEPRTSAPRHGTRRVGR